jgi:hypothetical protein
MTKKSNFNIYKKRATGVPEEGVEPTLTVR